MSIFVWLLGMIIDHLRVIFISDEPYEIYEWYKTEFPLRKIAQNWDSSKEFEQKLNLL